MEDYYCGNVSHPLQFIKNQTRELCLHAVKNFGLALFFVKEELIDYEICLEAVKQCGISLISVPNIYKTSELCLSAVTNFGLAIEFVSDRTPEIRLAAVKENPCSIQFIKKEEHTPELCLIVLRQAPKLSNICDEDCLKVIFNNVVLPC